MPPATVGCLFVLLFGEFRALGGYPRTRACLLAQVLGLGVLQHPPGVRGEGSFGGEECLVQIVAERNLCCP